MKEEVNSATDEVWFCDWCDKPMPEAEDGYTHVNGSAYCTEECAKKRDANYF